MYLSDFAKNNTLDYLVTNAVYGSLHTNFDSTGTFYELTGGGYARVLLPWGAADSGIVSTTATVTWNVPGSTTIRWFGAWDAPTGGNLIWQIPLGSGAVRSCSIETAADASAGNIWARSHGLGPLSTVVFWGILPPGFLSQGTAYVVQTAGITADSFIVGNFDGSPITGYSQSPENFFFQLMGPVTYSSPGTYIMDFNASIYMNILGFT